MEDLIEALYRALIHPHPRDYEMLRARIILTLGYDTFRDLQKEAFSKITKH